MRLQFGGEGSAGHKKWVQNPSQANLHLSSFAILKNIQIHFWGRPHLKCARVLYGCTYQLLAGAGAQGSRVAFRVVNPMPEHCLCCFVVPAHHVDWNGALPVSLSPAAADPATVPATIPAVVLRVTVVPSSAVPVAVPAIPVIIPAIPVTRVAITTTTVSVPVPAPVSVSVSVSIPTIHVTRVTIVVPIIISAASVPVPPPLSLSARVSVKRIAARDPAAW